MVAMRRRKGSHLTRSLYQLGREHWRYVYHLVDPRDGKVFYIGRGMRERINAHDREASRGLNTRKCKRIRDIWAEGLSVEKRIVALFDVYTYGPCKALELAQIHEHGYENLTNGNSKRFPSVAAEDFVSAPR